MPGKKKPDVAKRLLFHRVLSTLGFLFLIFLAVYLIRGLDDRAPLVQTLPEIPPEFSRDFSRVITKKRQERLPPAVFYNPDGDEVTFSEFSGRYLLVNFWATWCGPCVVELPSLQRLQEKLEDKPIDIVGVSMDRMRDQAEIALFLENRGIGKFAAYLDRYQAVHQSVPMRGIPTTYLLHPDGYVLAIFEGSANWSASSAVQFFQTLTDDADFP